ncbi:MAG: glycosyltransferase family 39 protein [Myxococcales bacterium]|nr:glycosyltransferase family 39 protein [Myxococcales bacterium]MCB9626123.1 glycosyltransferase family 39 protein [Sandaracinaceae bacterium]
MSQTRVTIAVGVLGALALALGGALGLERASHGLDAVVEVRNETGGFPLHHGFEPRPLFANRHRLNAIVLQKWNFRAHPIPTGPVPYRVTLSGVLEVPAGAAWTLRARGAPHTTLRIETQSENLAAGAHPLTLVLDATFPRDASVALEYQDANAPSAGFSPVPIESLRPATPQTLLRSTALPWWLGGAALFVVCMGLLATRDEALFRRRAELAVLLATLTFGLGARLFDYTVMPEYSENADELFATWNGFQLLTDGSTRGWSLWAGAYEGRVAVEHVPYFEGRPFDVIRPYLEHPPLLHVLAGAAAKLGGARSYLEARLTHTRLVPIALFVPTLLLLFGIARRLFPSGRTPYLAALLYAALPNLIIQQRVIKEEALLTPMALLGVYLFLRWDAEEPRRDRLIWAAAFVTGLGALAKVPGAFFLPPLVLLFFLRGGLRPALIACAGGLLSLLPLLLYGAYVDWNLFVFSTVHQASGRPAHWNLFPRFFADGLINHNLVGHGHVLFVWLGYALAFGKLDDARRPVLSLPPLIYMAALALSSGNWTFGWYILPVMPFVCLGAAHFLDDLLERPTFFGGLVLFGLLVMYGFNFMHDLPWAMEAPGWTVLRRIITPFMLVTLVPFVVAEAWPTTLSRRLARLMTGAGLAVFVVSSGYFALHYETLYETHRNFDRMVHFDR